MLAVEVMSGFARASTAANNSAARAEAVAGLDSSSDGGDIVVVGAGDTRDASDLAWIEVPVGETRELDITTQAAFGKAHPKGTVSLSRTPRPRRADRQSEEVARRDSSVSERLTALSRGLQRPGYGAEQES